LLLFMIVVSIAAIFAGRLFASVMLMGIFSLLSAALFVVLDAVDVAFTEAAVGAGVTVVLFLGALGLIKEDRAVGMDTTGHTNIIPATLICVSVGLFLILGTLDMPLYGDPDAPIHEHVAPHYIEKSYKEIGIPNIVTSVLASYRGYDTMGEAFVVGTGALASLAIIGRGLLSGAQRRRRGVGDSDGE
jgi:multicomponent Na+:H+ antiporter subunit B